MPTSHLHEIRHMRSGSLTNAPPLSGHPNAINMGGVPMPGPGGVGINHGMRFDQPRSPPNTSHVPCKFFKQGACQAGNTCPFNHDLSNASETVCKYFAKGNCKFGPKCANIHMLPDGRRINYGKNGVSIGGAPITLGNRINPATYGHTSTNSALTSSFMRNDNVPPYTTASPYPIPSENDHRYMHHHHLGRQPSLDNGLVPTIDTTHSSNPTSVYGSPRDDDLSNGNGGAATRLGLGMSPVPVPRQGLSVMDATLPASFDSNGISHAARYGPWPASVPNKFGLDSPSHSLGAAKDGRTSETLKMLHDSAFGGSAFLAERRQHQAGGERENNGGFGSSPPIGSGPGIGIGSASTARMMPYASNNNAGMGSLQSELESYYSSPRRGGGGEGGAGPYRISHSQAQAFRRPKMMSVSAPKQIDNGLLVHQQQQQHDSDTDFQFEEEYVPGELANEVLTPIEKARRGSSTYTVRNVSYGPDHDDFLPSPGGMNIGGASSSSAMNTPGMSTSKFGSPSAHSPSPWGSVVFNNRPREEDRDFSSPDLNGNSLSRSLKHASAFGHVGSPLRNSSLASAMSAEIMNNNNNNNNTNSSGNSPPAGLTSSKTRSGESLSALTQQFRQTSLDHNDTPHLHPLTAGARNGAIGSQREQQQQQHRHLDRHVSSGSISSSGRLTTPIQENEEENFVFNMEDETTGGAGGNHPPPPAAAQHQQQQQHTVLSSASAVGPPHSGGWSYASAVAAGGKGGGGALGAVGSMGNGAGVDAVGSAAQRGNGNGNSTVGTVGGR